MKHALSHREKTKDAVDNQTWFIVDNLPKHEIEMVREFHQAFEHPCPRNLTLQPIDYCKSRVGFVDEENKEYIEAVAKDDIVGIADAIVDKLYFVYGEAVAHGLDKCLYELFRIVHRANMEKLCTSEVHAQNTVTHYLDGTHPEAKGIPINAAWRKKETATKTYWVVYNKDTGKILKALGWTPPVLDEVINYVKSEEEKEANFPFIPQSGG